MHQSVLVSPFTVEPKPLASRVSPQVYVRFAFVEQINNTNDTDTTCISGTHMYMYMYAIQSVAGVSGFVYTTCAFARDLLVYSSNIIQQVVFVVSIPNAWRTIDKLVGYLGFVAMRF